MVSPVRWFSADFSPINPGAVDTPSPQPNSRQPISDGLGDLVLKSRIDERTQELNALERPRQQLPAGEMKLAGYLLGRAVDNRPVEGAGLGRLREANATVEQSRQLLGMGRGNVAVDIEATQGQSTRHAEAGRRLGREVQAHAKGVASRDVASVAASVIAQAGNCSEHANVATHLHAGKLGPGEEVHATSHKKADHSWAELKDKGDRDHHVVIDPWAEGPAIFAPDGEFTAKPDALKTRHAYDQQTGAQAHAEMGRLQGALPQPMQRMFEQKLEELPGNYAYREGLIFAPTPAISKEFTARVKAKMEAPIDHSKLAAKPVKGGALAFLSRWFKRPFSTPSGEAPTTTVREHAPVPVDSAAGVRERETLNQIKAIGVARALGSNVKNAVRHAEDIVTAAKHLRG